MTSSPELRPSILKRGSEMTEAFLGLAITLAIAMAFVLPYANSFITKTFPSVTTNTLLAALVQGAVLAAVVIAAKHFLGSKVEG